MIWLRLDIPDEIPRRSVSVGEFAGWLALLKQERGKKKPPERGQV